MMLLKGCRVILPMSVRGSRSDLKQSDNSRSQDHSEVLPGEKVSTHKTDSVSEEEFPLINYSIFSNARNSYGL